MQKIVKDAFTRLVNRLTRVGARRLSVTAAGVAGGVVCGPAAPVCGFLAGTLAGLVFDELVAAADAEQQAAKQEAAMMKVLLQFDFQKGIRRLEEVNAIRDSSSNASIADARQLIQEARGFFLNASSSNEFKLFAARADCYAGSCNALLSLPDLHFYEHAYRTCTQLENEFVHHPPGWAFATPDMNYAPLCAMYSRRTVLWQLKNLVFKGQDLFDKTEELYQQMQPLANLLLSRRSKVDGLVEPNHLDWDRYVNAWLDAKEKYCKAR